MDGNGAPGQQNLGCVVRRGLPDRWGAMFGSPASLNYFHKTGGVVAVCVGDAPSVRDVLRSSDAGFKKSEQG